MWNPMWTMKEADMVSHDIFRDGKPAPLVTMLQPPNCIKEVHDMALTNGREYRCWVDAFDGMGNRSDVSTEVATISQAGPEWEP
jgi:hypothetical protein